MFVKNFLTDGRKSQKPLKAYCLRSSIDTDIPRTRARINNNENFSQPSPNFRAALSKERLQAKSIIFVADHGHLTMTDIMSLIRRVPKKAMWSVFLYLLIQAVFLQTKT